MGRRAEQLHDEADRQIAELLQVVGAQTAETLKRAGRQKLGDGTLGALLLHTADNYQRIADFASGSEEPPSGHRPPKGAHKMPRFVRALGHRAPDHDSNYSAGQADPQGITEQLSAARQSLTQLATLTDERLDSIPPDGSFRFCDGKRTFEQVLAALLKHQDRQIDAHRHLSGEK